MKRSQRWTSGLAVFAMLLVAIPAHAQLNMQMGNGWSMAFSGNVNAFLVYDKPDINGDYAGAPGENLVGNGEKGFNIRTGLLPAFAVFSIKGRDNGRDLGATFGFAPEIQCGPAANNYVNRANCQGTQIDMRQVYLTVGGVHGGTLLMGRDLGLFGRQNILNDMTLFGTGPTGGPNGGGTTLGRIGFGYNYPNFNAQMTWSSAAGKNTQFSIGLFDPSEVANFTETSLPRVEAEWMMKGHSTNFWLSGLVQSAKDVGANQTLTSFGGSGGIKWWNDKVTLVGSGFFGSGIGTTVNMEAGATDGVDARKSFGFYGQGMYALNARSSLGVSYGQNTLQGLSAEPNTLVTNSAIVGGIYSKYGKMLRSTLEATYAMSKDDASGQNKEFSLSAGLLLLF